MKRYFCKKQYVYIGLALVSVGLALTTHVFAQEPQTRDTESVLANRERTIPVQGNLSEKIQNRIINLARNMLTKMNASINRLSQIISRMDSRNNL